MVVFVNKKILARDVQRSDANTQFNETGVVCEVG